MAGAVLLSCLPALADCTFTNSALTPMPEFGFNNYSNVPAGLYPLGANTRPPTHEAAGLALAQNLQPLDASGNADTNNGKIVLLSLGMSNTTQEWATKGTNHFTALATSDPALNPRVRVVDGAIGGQDAPDWTNANATTWSTVIGTRLPAAGVTTNQVQVLWLKQALAGPRNYGNFPLHAQALQSQLAIILRIAKQKYPNLKLAYLSCRTRAYTSTPTDLNPEPFAFETGFADKWVIEDQINGVNNLNYDPAKGAVVAPWLSWGPYIWADGLDPRSDALTWLCSDTESDFTHPSPTGGVPKVARQLLSFFKTDVTATPWFLRKNLPGSLTVPSCAPTASVTNGAAPLTVAFTAHASFPAGAAGHDAQWIFEDGESSTNLNPVKTFPTPGLYHARLTVTTTNGETAQGSVAVNVTGTFAQWQAAKFTAAELANPAISGDNANPDGDHFPNLLEYAMGLEPKTANPAATFGTSLSNGVFSISFPHLKAAADVTLTLETSNDLSTWSPLAGQTASDLGPVEILLAQSAVRPNTARFFRLKASQ